MELTIYNPQKGRLETVDIQFTDDNTTWFDCSRAMDIYMLTDFNGGLLIRTYDYTYPVWIYDISRANVAHDPAKVKRLMNQVE